MQKFLTPPPLYVAASKRLAAIPALHADREWLLGWDRGEPSQSQWYEWLCSADPAEILKWIDEYGESEIAAEEAMLLIGGQSLLGGKVNREYWLERRTRRAREESTHDTR